MHTRIQRVVLAAAVVGGALSSGWAFGQVPGKPFVHVPGQAPDLAHYGTWTINLLKTAAANGTLFTRGDTFTWIYQPEKDGIRHTIYETYPAPAPTRSYFARLDGQPYPDPHGAGRGLEGCVGDCQEFVRLSAINRYTVTREVVTKGKWTERVVWSVSADGNTLANVNISPNDPTQVGVMVFDRKAGPPSATR
jgi:hypothetical protein